MNPTSRHSSLDRNRALNGLCGSAEDIYRQRLDDAYYLRRMRDILQDNLGAQSRPVFPCQMTRLSECLFIGNQKNAEDLEELMTHGVTHVINCAPSKRRSSCSESPYPLETGIIGFKAIPAEDKEEYEIVKHFDETFNYLERVRQIRGTALVHCNMGVNRSGAIAAAYLMVSERRHLLEVIAYLKEKRNIILTNKGFRRQLIRYARSKQLLDPISNDYYVRRSGDFERLPLVEQQHAFSTPQLRRCTLEQKPPRCRNRNGRSKPLNIALPSNSLDDREDFLVKSLPRNMAGSRGDDLDQQWPNTSSPMTRRSISYIVKDLDSSFDDESDRRARAKSYHASSSRKSIAVDHINLASQTPSDEGRRHDDIPRLKVTSNLGRQFSSRYNLTISHPSGLANWKDDELESFEQSQQKKLTHHQVTPPKERPTSYIGNGESSLSTPKNRYCKQIRQHFSGLINLIRPNVSRNITSSQTSTPRSNQLFFALPFQKSETKAVRELPVGNPNQQVNHDGQGSYVSTNRIAMSAPRRSFQVTNVEENPRFFQQFSTRSNHVVLLRNRPTEEQTSQFSGGSLVLIGTRTSTLQPRSPSTNYTADQNLNVRQSETVPRKLRRYVRSKTDSELL